MVVAAVVVAAAVVAVAVVAAAVVAGGCSSHSRHAGSAVMARFPGKTCESKGEYMRKRVNDELVSERAVAARCRRSACVVRWKCPPGSHTRTRMFTLARMFARFRFHVSPFALLVLWTPVVLAVSRPC